MIKINLCNAISIKILIIISQVADFLSEMSLKHFNKILLKNLFKNKFFASNCQK